MKIREDFVTNSSSSCYVAMVIETVSGKQYSGCFIGDEVGHFDGGISEKKEDFTLKNAMAAGTGKELLDVIDAAYDGLFSEFDQLRSFFEEIDGTDMKANELKKNGIGTPVGGQEELERLPVSDIRSVKIIENREGDEFGSSATLEADLVKQEEHITSNQVFDAYDEGQMETDFEEIRNWKTGEKTVIRDETIPVGEDEEDYEDDEDDDFEDVREEAGLQEDKHEPETGNVGSEFVIQDGVLTHYNGDAEEVVIPEGVTTIAEGAFDRSNMKSVRMPNSVTVIKERSFSICDKLNTIWLPPMIEYISITSFDRCNFIKEIHYPGDFSTWLALDKGKWEDNPLAETKDFFCNGEKVTEYNIPEGTVQIGDLEFYHYHFLKKITIPDGVMSIGYEAFAYCGSVKEIIVPNSVKEIGQYAFCGCKKMKKAVLPKALEEMAVKNDIFIFCDRELEIQYV